LGAPPTGRYRSGDGDDVETVTSATEGVAEEPEEAPVAAAPAGRSGAARPRPRWLWLAGPLAVFAILRLPSFFEPHWYTDEAGYVITARGLLQGKLLYAQIWNNKPPIHLWTVAADTALLGSSEAALHLLTFLSGLLTLGAVAYIGSRCLGRGRASLALLGAAALLGSPLFDAQLLVPESLLIAPVSWAGALVVTRVGRPDRGRWPLWPALAGGLAALAVGYQQTALAETFAFAVMLALFQPPSPSPGIRSRRLAAYLAAFVAVTTLWLVPTMVICGGQNVAFALVGFYVAFTRSKYPASGHGIALQLLVPAAILVLVGISLWLRHRQRGRSTGLWLWAIAALLVPAVARQPYAHYLVPSFAPISLALSSLGAGWRRPARWPWQPASWVEAWAGIGARRGLAMLGICSAAVIAGWGGSVAGPDWGFVHAAYTHGLATYYGGAVRVLTGQQSFTAWQQRFDYRVSEDAQVAAWVREHGLAGGTAVIWSADAWVYELDHLQLLLRTAPIYNDEVLYGSDTNLGAAVAGLRPDLIVTEGASRSEYPAVNQVVGSGYRKMYRSTDGNEIVWLRSDLVLAASSG
jgi:hypothetical protein